MADLAQIGFKADTSELVEAKSALTGLVPAAASAEKASAGLSGAIASATKAAAAGSASATEMATSVKRMTSEVLAAARGEAARADATLKAARASDTASASEISAATALSRKAQATLAAARADDLEAMALVKLAAANNNATNAANRNAAANTNLANSSKGLQGQVGNIAAQFGDIGVQLAGGQSPFQIALQQGLQLIGVFGSNGLGAVLRGIGGAFMSLLSPLSLLTVGVIALGGYGVQAFMDWISAGDTAKLSLEDQNKLIIAISQSWGETVPAIQQYVDKLNEAKQAAEGAQAIETLRTQMTKDTTAAIEEANIAFSDLLSKLMAADMANPLINELNTSFQTLRDKVAEGKATQEDFNNVLTLVREAAATGIGGVNSFITTLQALASQAIKTTQAVSVMANTIGAAAAAKSPAMIRAGGVTSDENASPFDDTLPMDGPRIQSRPLIELEGTPWIHEAKGGKGRGGGAGSTKQTTTELQELNQALQALNEPFAQATTAYGTLQTALKNGVIDNDEYKASLEAIQDAFLKTGGTSDQWAQIMQNNGKKVADSSKEWSGIVKGFVSDLVGGIRQGKSLWESFGDAVNNVLDKIIDKLLNQFIDAIFTSNKAASGIGGGGAKGGGGFLGGILSWFGGLFSAKGNAFGGNGVMAFANGGAFSNSVVNGPTAFAFGKGGSNLGIMGEAGPEAVMPLKRGPNGSLGVQVHGGGSAANQNNITIAPVIQVEGSSGNEAQDQKQAARISDAVVDGINKIVDERMLANTVYGGVMKPRGYSN